MLISVQFKPQILYVTSTLNILTDGMILITPIPMLWNLNVGRSRKLGLSLLLFPGVFVIAAALIRVIMSLQVSPSALNINRWGVRETLAGVIAVNIPILRPILRSSFWTPGPVLNEKQQSNTSGYDDRSHSRKPTWTSSRGRKFLGLDPEQRGESEMPSKTVVEMSDRSSHYSNNSRGPQPTAKSSSSRDPKPHRPSNTWAKMVCSWKRVSEAVLSTSTRTPSLACLGAIPRTRRTSSRASFTLENETGGPFSVGSPHLGTAYARCYHGEAGKQDIQGAEAINPSNEGPSIFRL
jgi:hypothetical protein